MADDTNPNEYSGHDDPLRAGAAEGPDAQPDRTALDESQQDMVPDRDKADDGAHAAEDEAAKLGDFA